MEMEMMLPSPSADFNLDDSACTTPYISAPSSPERFDAFFFSPSRIPALYEETNATHDDDFTFVFSGYELEKRSISAADELFDGGRIKPLSQNDSRGRERTQNSSNSSSPSSRHKATRSLSPLRVSDLLLFDHNENIDQENTETSPTAACSSSDSSSVSSLISLWNRKWKLKDLLLFRSASESRATSNTEELNKYELVKKARQEDAKSNSTNVGAAVPSSRRRKVPISAHELHYKMKREWLKEMKKKTFLPYKQGLLGCSGLDDPISMYMTRRE
ncbi:uncharacterized protein [Nicotiana tomentosiformis]|uniref:uncharacterized protein n=1 Tax=Nicotiana tomentosiformis TaxID=4098 RepID=UPI00051BB8F9|nr:uncharacterized protein LOC104088937 isoform X1 [Nicotiana tomentosiformis]